MEYDEYKELLRKLVDDMFDIGELRQYVTHQNRYIRSIAIASLTRWINRHDHSLLDNSLIDDLVAIATDKHPYADMQLPGTYVTLRLLAIGCLLDINTAEAQIALQKVLNELRITDDVRFKEFLRDRQADPIFTDRDSPLFTGKHTEHR